MKTVLITGTSSGIGRDSVKYFQEQGWQVGATMRKPEEETELGELERVEVIALDVTKRESIRAAVEHTLETFGGLDVVVNNAGYGLAGPLEAVTPEQLERQYATNVFGPVYVMQAALPHFRQQGSGLFINISSIGGLTTLPLNSLYHGTKYALEGISESVNFELNPLGIRVKLVEPGGVKTDFSGRSLDMMHDPDISAYDDIVQKALSAFSARDDDYSTGTDVAKVIFEAATDGKPQLRYLAGEDAKAMLSQRESVSDAAYIAGMIERFGF